MTTWKKKPLLFNEKYISVVFTWQLWELLKTDLTGKVIGGPACVLHPEWIPKDVEVMENTEIDVLSLFNSDATRTTRGCPRRCGFCAVKKLHPQFIEIKNFKRKPIIIDDNFLACSNIHFNRVIDRLKGIEGVDFNQGLDARLLTKEKAGRLAELNLHRLRFSFDHTDMEAQFLRAVQILKDIHFPKSKISVYVLMGYRDVPEDALYRLELVRKLGFQTNPMRYQSLDTKKKNEFVNQNWTHKELDRFMVYWQNLRFLGSIPFKEFSREESARRQKLKKQSVK
jgi:hypothetical protein